MTTFFLNSKNFKKLFFFIKYEIQKSAKFLQALVLVESEMMGGGRMGKNSYQSQYLFSSFMFNVDVRVLEYWCPRI